MVDFLVGDIQIISAGGHAVAEEAAALVASHHYTAIVEVVRAAATAAVGLPQGVDGQRALDACGGVAFGAHEVEGHHGKLPVEVGDIGHADNEACDTFGPPVVIDGRGAVRVGGPPVVELEVVIAVGKVDGAPHPWVARGREQRRRSFHIGIAEEGAVTAVHVVGLVAASNEEEPEGQKEEDASHGLWSLGK